MKYEYYPLIYPDDLSYFDFVSVGKNGKILKRITFRPTDAKDVYGLSFGDVNETNELDDLSVSDNGDRNKVLSTVARIIDRYTRRYPHRTIYFIASTDARTRLYRMAISLHWEELSAKYFIYVDPGWGDGWVPFYKGLEVKAFLIRWKGYY